MLQVVGIGGPTMRRLTQMLRDKGLTTGRVQGVVRYGYAESNPALPTLNKKAGRYNKYEELVVMDDAGVPVVPFSRRFQAFQEGRIVGRNLHHTRGRDIVIYRAGEGRPHKDYYTELIPKEKEFRVWVYRDKTLATYEKKLEYPQKYGRRGRNKDVWNWHNGFAFMFVQPEDASDGLKRIAIEAVCALDLDFGAVDALYGEDGHYYVLEVNSAPGTQGEARQGIMSLANCIERWAKGGFKERQ